MIAVAATKVQKATYSTYNILYLYQIAKLKLKDKRATFQLVMLAFDCNGQPVGHSEHAQINPLVLV